MPNTIKFKGCTISVTPIPQNAFAYVPVKGSWEAFMELVEKAGMAIETNSDGTFRRAICTGDSHQYIVPLIVGGYK